MTTATQLLSALNLGANEFAAEIAGTKAPVDVVLSDQVIGGVEGLVSGLESDLEPKVLGKIRSDFAALRQLAEGGKHKKAKSLLIGIARRIDAAEISGQKYAEVAKRITAIMQDDTASDREVEELVQRYLKISSGEITKDDAALKKTIAAFSAGTILTLLKATEIYDPIDHRYVRVEAGKQLIIAEHEGNVLIGELSDNSHSIGVLYQEEKKWHRRKYFLPLSVFVNWNRVRIEEDMEATLGVAPVKGRNITGKGRKTAVAIKRLEELNLSDDFSFLPRGTIVIFPKNMIAKEVGSGKNRRLVAGTRATVVKTVGDIAEIDDDGGIQIQVGEKTYLLDIEALLLFDPDKDVLTLEEQEALSKATMKRREVNRLLLGGGLAAFFAATTFGVFKATSPKKDSDSEDAERDDWRDWYNDRQHWTPERRNHMALATLFPEASALYGYFSAKDHYWWSLKGIIMQLSEMNAKEVVQALEKVADPIFQQSAAFYRAYENAFYNLVHSGWLEIKHYTTDSKGNTRYSHSTWIKTYSHVWTEPPGLKGFHNVVEEWRERDRRLAAWTEHMLQHGLFDLLKADAKDAEKDFQMAKNSLGVGRDAAIAAISMALMSLPVSFYDEIWAFLDGRKRGPSQTEVSPEQGFFPFQKEALLAAGMAVGIGMATRSSNKLQRVMVKNKEQLGATLEKQIRRVPGLDFNAAWQEYYDLDLPEPLAAGMTARKGILNAKAPHVQSFSYTYGTGWDSGRPLDSKWVDASPVQAIVGNHAARWPQLAKGLLDWFQTPTYPDRLRPVLQNAIGTRIVENQIDEDKEEASEGSFNRSLAFALPMWGAVLGDLITKAMRKGPY